MPSILSKRQQARNEKALQELVHKVPGNAQCADCQARNPSWASWNIGIFLCMRCAAIHRKLGTHISKVKSLSMDAWTNEQVENMKKMGNDRSNQLLNPQNTKPHIPIDADEADLVMERFIRQKYSDSHRPTGRTKTMSDEDELPPPLPPKSPPGGGARSSLRSASSTFPLSSRLARGDDNATATAASASAFTTTASNNPFDLVSASTPAQPQSAQSTGTMHNHHSRNPYALPHHMARHDFNQTLGNLSLAAPSQPLFPNHTGGFPAQQVPSPQPPYQQSMTPPVSSPPFMSPFGLQQQQQQQQQFNPQPLQPQHTANPFWNTQAQALGHQNAVLQQQQYLHQQQHQQQYQYQQQYQQQYQNPQQQHALAVNTTGGPNNNNPFVRSPTRIQPPSALGQIPEQSQAAFYNNRLQQYQQLAQPPALAGNTSNNPFAPQPQTYAPPRPDKASIMALYNYPHLAPQPQPQPQSPSESQDPTTTNSAAPALSAHQPRQQQNRSVSTPLPQTKNPFAQPSSFSTTATPAPNGPGPSDANAAAAQPKTKKSQPSTRESVAMGLEMAWSNGRHSPDAFASLSSRYR